MAIVYRTENLINRKFYYGVHSGDNDEYLGSGLALNRAISKYSKENFKRRTIRTFNTIEEAYAFEALMVDELLLADPMCYNIALGGLGGVGKGDPWNKGMKHPGVGGRKPGCHSTRKGKVFSPLVSLSIETGIPNRTIMNWVVDGRKPNNTNKNRWSTYLRAVEIYKQGLDLKQRSSPLIKTSE